MNRKYRNAETGFTLIEVMVVVAIIGTMMAIIAPNMLGRSDEAKQVAAKADIRAIEGQMSLYKLDNYSYPTTAEGIQALVSNPGSKGNWRGYLDSMPLDPWKNPYQYLRPGQKNPSKFDIWSFGRDGAPGGEKLDKDIGNWDD